MAFEPWEGAIFRTSEEAAVEFFCALVPKTELRLVCLDQRENVYGIYSVWKGEKPVFQEIARLAPEQFDSAISCGYYSAFGFENELYKDGILVRSVSDFHEGENQEQICFF